MCRHWVRTPSLGHCPEFPDSEFPDSEFLTLSFLRLGPLRPQSLRTQSLRTRSLRTRSLRLRSRFRPGHFEPLLTFDPTSPGHCSLRPGHFGSLLTSTRSLRVTAHFDPVTSGHCSLRPDQLGPSHFENPDTSRLRHFEPRHPTTNSPSSRRMCPCKSAPSGGYSSSVSCSGPNWPNPPSGTSCARGPKSSARPLHPCHRRRRRSHLRHTDARLRLPPHRPTSPAICSLAPEGSGF